MGLIEKLIELELTYNIETEFGRGCYKEKPEAKGKGIFYSETLQLPIREANSEYELMDTLEKDAMESIRNFKCVKPSSSVHNAISELYKCKFYGPYIVLCGKDDKNDEYIRIEGVDSVAVSNVMEENEIYLVQVTPDVVRLVIGQLPIEKDGKWVGCMVLQLRADYYNNCGIAKVV